MAFSNNLRYLRKKYNMSQEDLASKLGYKSFTTIQKWESGISEPSFLVAQNIANIFNVSIDALIGDEGYYYLNPDSAVIAQEISENPELKMLFDASRKVSPEDLKFVIEMVERLKDKEKK